MALVLHDLNQACRFADHLIVMKDGDIVEQGVPSDIMTESLLHRVFDVDARIIRDPVFGTPLVIPIGALRSDA